MSFQPYTRQAAVTYAHRWAYGRNPAYYNFDSVGGDCTSYASQCLLAGAGVMDFTKTFGWYYKTANDKAPAWSGVEYFFNFLTRKKETPGPVAEVCAITDLQPGDFVQLRFDPVRFAHTPIVVAVGDPPTPENVLVAAHSFDTDNRPLATYEYAEARFLHITGVRR